MILFVDCLFLRAQCIVGNEKYPDTGFLLKFNDDDYSQGDRQIKETCRAPTHNNTLETYISENDCRSDINGNDVGYNIHAFDIRYQKTFESAQPKKVEFKFDGVIDAAF